MRVSLDIEPVFVKNEESSNTSLINEEIAMANLDWNKLLETFMSGTPSVLGYLLSFAALGLVAFALYVVMKVVNKLK